MKKAVIAASVATMLSASANADVLGLYIGGQVWNNQAAGSFGEVDNIAEFTFEDEQQGSYFVAFEHPVPLIPNFKIGTTTLDTTGMSTFDDGFEFGGVPFPNGQANTVFNTNFVDYTLYYELFSNDLVAFDFGLTARDIEGDITVTMADDPSINGDLKYDEIIPMLYVNTKIGLPFTGFNVFGEANFLSTGDHTMYDYQVGVGYELLDNLAIDLDLQVGYRSMKLELSDISDLYTDLEFDGAYAGAVIHF